MDKSPNGGSKALITVEDIIKTIFGQVGITFAHAVFLRRRIIDDRIIPQVLTTLGALAEGFQDGTYEFALDQAVITDVGKAPVELPWVYIEISYIDGAWSEPNIYADEETISLGEDEEQILFARLRRTKERLIPVLRLLDMIVKLAQAIRGLFS